MANQITDTRTLIHAADAVAPYDDLSGAAAGTLDTEIFVEGTGSIGQYITSTRDGLLYDFTAATDLSSNVFYIRINCGIVGLLDTQANGGFAIRFAGATVTDWFEVYVGGSDSWPSAIAGGWVTFVVDIEDAYTAAVTNGDPGTATNGTPPATNAVRYVGYSAITGGTMPRMVDNTWMDAMYRLPDGSAGITIEGRNGGATDWAFADIYAALGDAAGTFFPSGAGGAWTCNTPIQFGIDDGSTHAFTDTNQQILWQDQQYAPADLYGLTISPAATGTNNVTFGIKSGTGSAATGSQGCTFSAGASQVRFFVDADGANIDSAGFYGCTFIHGGDFQFDNTTVEVVSSNFLDCTSLVPDNSALFQRNSIVDANTADGVAFITSDDLSDLSNNSFTFSDGHAIEITSAAGSPFTFTGNQFASYGGTPGTNLTPSSGSTDAAIYNNSGAAITINVGGGGDTPSIRNAASSTTTVNNNVTVTLTGMKDNSEVRVYDNASPISARTELAGIEDAITGTTDDREFSFSLGAGTVTNIVVYAVGFNPVYFNQFTIPSSDASLPVSQQTDRSYENPP